MQFKKAIFYKLNTTFPGKPLEELEKHFRAEEYKPIAAQQSENFGWVEPAKDIDSSLIHHHKDIYLFCMRKEVKQIPASAVKEAVDQKVKAIEQTEGRKVFGKERTAIKDDVLSLMRPRALTKSEHVYGYIDSKHQILVVGASPGTADDFVQLLIDTLGTLGAVKLMGEESPSLVMNRWCTGVHPLCIQLTGDFKMEDSEGERSATIRNDGIYVTDLLEDGYLCSMIGIEYRQGFSAKLDKSIHLSSIKFNHDELASDSDLDSECLATRFNADLYLTTRELGDFYKDICDWFRINVEQ